MTAPPTLGRLLRSAGGPSVSPSGSLGTLTLVNDDPTNASSAGSPTRMFGWVFPPGTVAPHAGVFPKFTIGGTEHLYSMSPPDACRFWSDGSLMFATFALKAQPSGVAANGGTQTVAISTKAGSWPAATRTTTDIYNQALGVWAPMHSGSPFDAGTNWAAVLATGNTNNIRKVRKWLQGDAGDCWCFTVDLSGGASGSFATPASTLNAAPHGLLAADIYAWALTDVSGALGGVRFWADVRQPYIDGPVSGFGGSHLSPAGNATKDFRYFAPPNGTTPAVGLGWTENGTIHALGAAGEGWPFPTSPPGYTATAQAVNNASFNATIAPISATATGALNVFSPSNIQFSSTTNSSTWVVGMLFTGTGITGPCYVGNIITQSGSNLTIQLRIGVGGNATSQASTTLTGAGGLLTYSGPITGSTPAQDDFVSSGASAGTQITGYHFPGTVDAVVQPSQTVSSPTAMTSGPALLTLVTAPPQDDGIGPSACPHYVSGTSAFGGFTNSGGDGLIWYSKQPDTSSFWFYPDALGGSYNNVLHPVTANGSTVTVLPLPISEPGMRFAIGGGNGEWIFFTGSGSITADTPLRSGIVDQTAWVKSQAIPPFAISPSSMAPSVGVTGSGAEVEPYTGGYGYLAGPGIYAYWPYCMGGNGATAAGGWTLNGGFGHYLIGAPVWVSSDFWSGDATSYRQMLYSGLGFGCWLADYVMSTAPTVPPNTGSNLSPTGATRSYVGMGPTTPFASGLNAGPPSAGQTWPGYTAPTNSALVGVNPNEDRCHQSDFAAWAFLRTGRPELLDRLLMQFSLAVFGSFYGSYTVIPSKTYQNAVMANAANTPGRQFRGAVNMMRYVAHAARLYPSDPSGLNNTSSPRVSFDGTQFSQYALDTIDDNFAVLNDFVDPQYAVALYPVPTNPGATFTGSISSNTLTVQASPAPVGTLAIGQAVADANGMVNANKFITVLGTGSGGAGTYTVQKFTAGTYSNDPQTVGPLAMFSGAPAINTNDKEHVTPLGGGNYLDRGNTTGIAYCLLPFVACEAVLAGSAAAAKWLQNDATNQQAYADRRGDRINSWNIGQTFPIDDPSGGAYLTSLNDKEFGWLPTIYKIISTPSNYAFQINCSNVTPSSSVRAFSMTYTGINSSIVLGNGDLFGFISTSTSPALPPGLSFTVYEVADWISNGSGGFNFNLLDATGARVAPGANATDFITNAFFSTGLSIQIGGYGARGAMYPGQYTDNYQVMIQGAFSWAKALVDTGHLTDPNGYIANVVTDLNTRMATAGLANNSAGALWNTSYGPGNNLMATFAP